MRKSEDWDYHWELQWNGSCYRGWYRELTFRDWWWIPLMITVGPNAPVLLAVLISWLLHL